jgi:hypothetical protein
MKFMMPDHTTAWVGRSALVYMMVATAFAVS